MAVQLDDLESDALREIGEVSAASAATAIAKFTGRRVETVTNQLHAVAAKDLAGALGVEDRRVTGSAIRLAGDVRGALALAFPGDTGRKTVNLLTGGTETDAKLSETEQSALKEFCNIATGAYLKMFYDFLGSDVDWGVPAFIVADWQALIKYTFLGNTPGASQVWAVSSEIDLGLSEPVYLYLLLDAEGMAPILDSVRRMVGSQ